MSLRASPAIYGASQEGCILKYVLNPGDNFVVFKVNT